MPMLAASIILGSHSGPAYADGLTLVGSTFPMRNCRVQSMLGGQIVYTDPAGQ